MGQMIRAVASLLERCAQQCRFPDTKPAQLAEGK